MRFWLGTFSLVCALLLLSGPGSAVDAAIDLQFDNPAPPVVSRYSPPVADFYIAKRQATILALEPQFNYTPKVVASYFKEDYLTFNTEYAPGKSLVPVSVDAQQYNVWRKNRFLRQRFAFFGQKSFANSQAKAGPGGLAIGIGLPKQLDKVFGEGGGNLKVSGYRRISFSGRSSWTDGVTSDALSQSRFPSLNMDQVYRFDIEGTIGTKISVKVSEDSQTDIPLANRIMLRYKGDDDDIIKSIEAGNTTLSLPNTQFVGYSSNIQGLFGLKTEAQIGKLSLTAIASQEKGSSERASVSANGEEKANTIRDYAYVQNRIFDLYPGKLQRADVITDIQVFEQNLSTGTALGNSNKASLFIDPADTANPNYTPFIDFKVQMQKVDPNSQQYQQYSDTLRNMHYLVFNAPQQERAIGVWMKVVRHRAGLPDTTFTVGNIDDSVFHLLTIRPAVNYAPSHPTWNYMWRNIYAVPAGLAAADLGLKIYKGPAGTEGSAGNVDVQTNGENTDGTYLKILGLDQYNQANQNQSDGILDDRQEVYRSDWGLIIFPSRKPFSGDTSFTVGGIAVPKLQDVTGKIYDYTSLAEQSQNSKYYLSMSSKVRGSVINLNRANIIENSERVTANGRQLTRGVDYTIDYSFGRVTLISPEATDPNAAVNVDFEYAPFLSLQQKTLLGFRGEYQASNDLKFGSTYLYKSDKAEDRKPQVGQETAKMSVIDFDATWKLYPKFMTKIANALPFIHTEAPSTMTVSAEVAESHPNPNVNDVAYIDDFEAALDQLNLPSNRASWTLSSWPVQVDQSRFERAKMLWHNVVNGIAVDSVYDRQSAQGQGTIQLMRMVFRPQNRFLTNQYVSQSDTASSNLNRAWAGIMTYFGNAVDPYRAQLFEVRLKGWRGKLHFDFGKISEDINGDGAAETEDKNSNGACEPAEDVGLDGKADADEPGYDAAGTPDPDGDDFYSQGSGTCPLPLDSCSVAPYKDRFNNPSDPLYYEYLNGTEGNLHDLAVVGQPDQEALSRNGFNPINSYFSFKINLADTTSDSSFYVQNSNLNGWRTYRIPIQDPHSLDTTVEGGGQKPDWSQISHVRVWFEGDRGDSTPDTVLIANWYFVQSNWLDTLITRRVRDSSTTFVVASVSTEDHIYVPPPGVVAYTDPTTNVTEPQRGLSLAYKNIRHSDTCLAIKKLPSVDTYSGYRRLQMYVHGDTGPGRNDSIQFMFRLGSDSANYYEYHTLVHPDWDPRNYVDIDFNVATALKDAAQKALPKGKTVNQVDTTDGNYRVVGNPSINLVQWLASGIVNLDTARTATGTVWVDELRVTDVRKDVGRAGRISVDGSLADLGSYNFRYENRNPYFRGISATTRGGSSDNLGSGMSNDNYSWSASLNMEKFLPRSWSASVPIGYSYSKSTQVPILETGSDVILTPIQQQEEKSQSVSKSFRASEAFTYRGRSPLFNLFLNRQKFNFSYSRNSSFDANRPYSFGENYNVNGQFDMGVKSSPSLSLFSWAKSIPLLKMTKGTALYFWPTTWSWTGTFDRTLSINDDISHNRVSSLQRGLDLRSSIDYKVLNNLSARFEWSTKRDLSDPTQVDIAKLRLGLETNYTQSFSSTYSPRFVSWLGTGLAYSANYSDNYDRTTASRTSSMSNQWSIGGDFKHLVLFGKPDQSSQDIPRPQSTGKAGTKSKGSGKPFYSPFFAALRFLTGWIDPIQYKYSKTFNANLPGMLERPSWSYRFGLYRMAGVPTVGQAAQPFANSGYNYSVSTHFQVMGGISTNIGYKTAVTQDEIRQGARMQQQSTNWPDLDITISKFTTFPLIKKYINHFIQVFEPQTAFSRQIQQQKNLDGGFVTSHTVTTAYNPLLSVRFKVWQELSMSASYTLSKTSDDENSTVSGTLQKQSLSTQKSINMTARYSFRAPGGLNIPIFGKVKINSTVNLQLDVRRSTSKSETSDLGGPFATFEDKADFIVSPTISYSFSQQIQGGLTGLWQDTDDNYTSKTSHVRQLQIWAEIRF